MFFPTQNNKCFGAKDFKNQKRNKSFASAVVKQHDLGRRNTHHSLRRAFKYCLDGHKVRPSMQACIHIK